MTKLSPGFLGVLAMSAIVFLCFLPSWACGQQEESVPVSRVGTTEAPPFAMKTDAGDWEGIAVDLIRELAEEIGVAIKIEERAFQDLLTGVTDGSLDAAVAAITITSDREEVLDFSHPFYTTGLAIAVPSQSDVASWLAVAEGFFSLRFFYVLCLLVLVLFIAGFAVWLFERRVNPEMFGGKLAKGIGSGFWWSAVTMTTVGYGDKAPKTPGGRIVALIWMFTSIIIISSFTAAITSSLTVGQLTGPVKGLQDLRRVRVGTVEGSTGAAFLEQENIRSTLFKSTKKGLEALSAKKIDAFVQDAPILEYLVNTGFKDDLQVLPGTFARQDYGIALAQDAELREELNRALLTHIYSREWQTLLDGYLER